MFQIHCSCTSFSLDSPNIQSLPVESEEFYAGIQVCLNSRLCWEVLIKFYETYYIFLHIFQMKPQAVSISEDGREYNLTVESTVPLPCSSERCTLPLHLTTSSQGGVKNCSYKSYVILNIFCIVCRES